MPVFVGKKKRQWELS